MLLACAYAIDNLWSAPSGITITTSSPWLKVRSLHTGQVITSLDVGNFIPGSKVSIDVYILNTHPNASIQFKWNSTLLDVTDKITDSWIGTRGVTVVNLDPMDIYYTTYTINVSPDCPYGTYSWTLYLYGPN
jgi:hypothetical protein